MPENVNRRASLADRSLEMLPTMDFEARRSPNHINEQKEKQVRKSND